MSLRNKKGQFVKGCVGVRKGTGKKIKKKCLSCGEEFTTRRERIMYCCQRCYWNDLTIRQLGKKNPSYKDGRTILVDRIRHCKKYANWVKQVFTRDNYTCQKCNIRGCYLEAHHKEMFSKIWSKNNIKDYKQAINCKELWNIDNGETLCKDCHKLTRKKI